MTEFSIQHLLSTQTVVIRDVVCRGACRYKSTEECSGATHLVFPYRGVYVRHLERASEFNQELRAHWQTS